MSHEARQVPSWLIFDVGQNMKHFVLFLFFTMGIATFAAEERWIVVEDGFRFSLPADWQKEAVRGTDSHVGRYRGKSAYLEFDEVFGLGRTTKESEADIAELKQKEARPGLLKPGEEIWHVGGRIAEFWMGTVDPTRFGDRGFPYVATLFVPYEIPACLGVHIFYTTESDLPTIRRILKSIEWKKSPTRRQSQRQWPSRRVLPKELRNETTASEL